MTHGIHTIDTGFGGHLLDAAYLIVEDGHAAFIDCGTHHGVPRLLRALRDASIKPTQVDWVIPTHVHLDHAGGAGELMAHLPYARLAVHPRGMRHMIDPDQLWAGASAVYGESVMDATYGKPRPIIAERITAVEDGHVIMLAGRALRCLHTPGHARHHMCIYDERANICFTGDAFGMSYRAFDNANGAFVLPTTSPVQFDPRAMKASIDRLVELKPVGMCLTHYGRIGHNAQQVQRFATELKEQVDSMVALANDIQQQRLPAPKRHEQLKLALADLYAARLAVHDWFGDRTKMEEILSMDLELNSQGLAIWLDGQHRGAQSSE
jgi:glyoxylase-like metal-dependent hydrolase (beta-lactamase superfamily II)